VEAAKATLRSVSASEEAAQLAAQDAVVRHLEAALDTVLKMRHMFNIEHASSQSTDSEHFSEQMEPLVLCRELEARMVTVTIRFGQNESLSQLVQRQDWSSNDLEAAIDKLKEWIKEAALPKGDTQG
jgi:hypothetical protein